MSVITVQPVLRHLLDRMKVNYVPPEQYNDDEILVLLNDAYRDACERTRCLQAISTITLVSGQAEYALPDDFSELEFVCAGGRELYAVSLADALASQPGGGGYYLYGQTIGFTPTPSRDTSMASTMIAYSAKPAPLLTLDDGFDARFPVEYADLLLHWVVWRVETMSGGAEKLRNADANHSIMDTRVRELRRTIDRVDSLQPRVLQHVSSRHLGASV